MVRKLKPDRGIQQFIPAIVSLMIFAVAAIVFNFALAFDVLGVIMLAYAFIFGFFSFMKTSNNYFLVSFMYLITLGIIMIILDIPEDFRGPKPEFGRDVKLALVFIYFFMFWLAYIMFRKKLKYRGREVMELAARGVEESADTYTERPRPAGKVEYSPDDILSFAQFLKQKLICMPYIENNRVVLLPVKMGDEFRIYYSPGFDYLSNTWIAFDFEGWVSVHISRRDYLDYKMDLSFDHLCESLGQLMIHFADLYMNGNETRIMDKLNTVNTGLLA